MSSSSQPAVPTHQAASVIGDTKTELLVQEYDDQIMVIVTQVGKVGSWVSPCSNFWSLPTLIEYGHVRHKPL